MPGNSIPAISIDDAQTPAEISLARTLFTEYAAQLGFSLCFQSFEEELASLPGKYAAPQGRLMLARCDGEDAGCGALRPLSEPGVCEMKRLYVRPQFRGKGVGVALILRLIECARSIGYSRLRLDTVPSRMARANQIYDRLGFYEITAYCHNPQPGVRYLELDLR